VNGGSDTGALKVGSESAAKVERYARVTRDRRDARHET